MKPAKCTPFIMFTLISLLTACGDGTSGGGAPAELYVTDGPVYATALSPDGNTLYIGGDFTRVGPRTGGFVPIDDTSGLLVGSFPKVDGSVLAGAPDGSGGWYIGGNFALVGTVARNNIGECPRTC